MEPESVRRLKGIALSLERYDLERPKRTTSAPQHSSFMGLFIPFLFCGGIWSACGGLQSRLIFMLSQKIVIFYNEIKKVRCFFFDTGAKIFAVESLANSIFLKGNIGYPQPQSFCFLKILYIKIPIVPVLSCPVRFFKKNKRHINISIYS